MKIEALHVGQQVRHPQYGNGVVKTISEKTAEVRFNDALRVVDPEVSELIPAEASASLSGVEVPLRQLIESTVQSLVDRLGLGPQDGVVEQLGVRWQKGKAVLHPSDPSLQTKEIPLDVFFHKVVGIRNQLRVLEQKVNSHPGLSDGEKVEMQQYISRCYGSLTTFNLLFKNKEDQFCSKNE
jgi:hypothetical protein